MITITGASGKLGRAVAQALGERTDKSQVILGSRTPSKLDDLRQQGFRTAVADFDQPQNLEDIFRDAEAALVICGHGTNETRIRQHKDAFNAAKAAGAQRVLYTSFTNPVSASLFPFAQVHEASEALAHQTGLRCTFLRNNHYAENLEAALSIARKTGEIALPGARGKVAYISRADVGAATAAALLRDDGHTSIDITGSTALDLFEVAQLASQAWGIQVSAREMSPDEYACILAARGLPNFVIHAQVGIRLAAGAGEYATVTGDARALAGRELQSMADYLKSFA